MMNKPQQLIKVFADDFNSFKAHLKCYELVSDKYERIERLQFDCVIGKNGYANTTTSQLTDTIPLKKEGDMRTPFGLHPLGTVFGYAPIEEAKKMTTLPYIQCVDDLICVDDVTSEYYNQIISIDKIENKNISFEKMRRPDAQYEWGINIEYNCKNPLRAQMGNGSCIFIHIWKSPNEGTAGCVAMAQRSLLAILPWLKTGATIEFCGEFEIV